MAQNNTKPTTSTQICTMYSDGMACMNLKFYNTSLAFQLYAFQNKDANGISHYDTQNGQQTTVTRDGAAALYIMAKDIVEERMSEGKLTIPCMGASVTLDRHMTPNGPETIFSIQKNNVTIPFRFSTITATLKDQNGTPYTKVYESGLAAFAYTILGYLDGINAERHLNKLTDDYAKLQNQNGTNNTNQNVNNQQRPNNNQQNRNYQNNNNYRRPQYNNQNNGNNGYNNNRPKQWNSQRFDSYQVQQ